MSRGTPTLFSPPIIGLTPEEHALEEQLFQAIRREELPDGKIHLSLLSKEALALLLSEILHAPKQFEVLISLYLKHQEHSTLPSSKLFMGLINSPRLNPFWRHHLQHLEDCHFVDTITFSPTHLHLHSFAGFEVRSPFEQLAGYQLYTRTLFTP